MPEWAEVSAILHSSVAGIWHVLQSTFSTAVVGSLTGAFGGAWAAKKIADRSKLREELLKEIRNTNAAATMIYGIANTYIGLKKQHVKRLYEEYHSQRDNFELFLKSSQARMAPPRQTFQFNADLMTLNTPNSPTEQIENIIFNQISITGPVLFVTPILLQSIQSIRETFTERNMLINEFRAHGSTNPYVYFGIGHDNHVDQRYMNTVNGISALNDDVIGLSIMIGEALSECTERVFP